MLGLSIKIKLNKGKLSIGKYIDDFLQHFEEYVLIMYFTLHHRQPIIQLLKPSKGHSFYMLETALEEVYD